MPSTIAELTPPQEPVAAAPPDAAGTADVGFGPAATAPTPLPELADGSSRADAAAEVSRSLGNPAATFAPATPQPLEFRVSTPPVVGAQATETRLGDGRILLEAGDGDDTITIRQDGQSGDVEVDINGEVRTYTPREANRLVIRGGDGDDTIRAASTVTANLTLEGNAGADVIVGGSGHDRIEGGAGNDTIHAGGGRDYVYGGDGDDTIHGEDGNDILYGGDGSDTIHAGNGDDYVDGGAGDDLLYGGTGNDVLAGGLGDDLLEGGTAEASEEASGNDILYAGRGQDRVSGGTGDVAYTEATDTVVRGDGETGDLLRTDLEIDADLGTLGITIDPGLSGEEQARIESDLEMLRSSPTGQEGLAAIDAAAEEHGNTIRITRYSEENGQAEPTNTRNPYDAAQDPTTGEPGPGTDALVTINPQLSSLHFTDGRSDPVDSSADFHDLPPVGVLYHELAHAYDMQTGRLDIRTYQGQDPYDRGRVPNSERIAVGVPIDHDGDPRTPERLEPTHLEALTENTLRRELGLLDRPSYAR